MIGDVWLTRKEAANFILTLDFPMTAKRLERMAANNNSGGGPPFVRSGWRTVHYHKEEVRNWVDREKARQRR